MTHTNSASPMRMATYTAALALIAGATLAGPNSDSKTDATTASTSSYSIDLAFITHLDLDLPEQDVFIEREPRLWRGLPRHQR